MKSKVFFNIVSVCVLFLISFQPLSAQTSEDSSFKTGLQEYFRGNYETARDHFQNAVEENPDQPRYQFFLANTYHRLGQDTRAKQGYKAVLEQDEDHDSARTRLANLYYEEGQWTRAIPLYETLLEGETNDPQIRFRLARSLFEDGQLNRAQTQFLQVRQRDPDRARVFYYLGRILLEKEEYLNAGSRFERAIQLDDSPGEFYFYRALAFFRQEDYLSDSADGWKSADDFERAIERGNDENRTYFMLGNSLLNRGLYLIRENRTNRGIDLLKKSIRQYQRVLTGEWKASNAYHNMGVAYLEIGKLDLARKAVEQAILIEPTVPFFHDTLGDIYFQMGEFDRALDAWELVGELEPEYDGNPFAKLRDTEKLDVKIQEARVRR